MAEQSIKDLAYRTAAGVLGSPVDIATMFMRPFGYKTPDTEVFGSSEYLGKKMEDVGLISSARSPITEFITSLAVPTPGGVAKGAALAAPALAGIFVGKGSKTWDVMAATKAKELDAARVDPKVIWQQTGTWKGPDGKWRQEIDDQKAFYDPDALKELKAQGPYYAYNNLTPLGGLMGHKELYKAYPDVGDIPTQFTQSKNLEGVLGSYSPAQNRITLTDTPVDQKSTLLHEIQHAIQNQEGFSRGGNADQMVLVLEKIASQKRLEAQNMFNLSSARDPLDPTRIVKPGAKAKGMELEKEARELDDMAMAAYRSEQARFDLYRRLGGEAEARAVQSRMDLTPTQRQATFPEESYDIPINQVINR